MKNDVHVILTAGGTGSRFTKSKQAVSKPKQFLNLLGKPVILHSLIKFQKNKEVKSIYISASKEYFSLIHSMAVKNKITKLKALIEGGKTRFESVRNAFNQVECRGDDIILIHDAARPNLSVQDLSSLINAARRSGEAILGVRVSDTVKRTSGGTVRETIDRNELWLIQTPQAFRYDVLSRSYIIAGSKTDFTDEASLVEFAGYDVTITEGSRFNIKLTSAEDMLLLKKAMT
ncbi:MAG TPA: 2-C-methyl-D-erythritol 4-phosphate cytidylyltransferase [Ignavibacteria bacterium]|nr:2-C-methyl-D-erythritol 4-phosphate cytidylyltransferase [Ignavibacteria bacterium]HMQ98285.1 2-C-methyl-D-erythritol 4-phosphate cytidylyltransferase [Ignavibacteria bacterium]